MAFNHIKNVRIEGIAACVPGKIEENSELALWSNDEYERFRSTTGIERRRIVESGTCTSDLCFVAAERIIEQLKWDKTEIDCLIFVSQTPDYKLPATACVLQDRLGISKNCMSFDISLGCSGWIYGITTLAALLQSGYMKRGLLLVGDTVSTTKSPIDKATYPLFGDAGTATALQFSEDAKGFMSCMFTDGGNYEAIMIRDGGARHPVTPQSFDVNTYTNGTVRNNLQSILDGPTVFTFGISKAPQSVNRLTEYFSIDKEDVDFFVFHQANLMMNEKIRNKLNIPEDKVPYTLRDFGNTSSASIPLTMVCNLKKDLEKGISKMIACGFGVGLSWGALYFETENIQCCQLIEI
jgi:3-oxoacyl-[acyl-carrier-protein] synthase-3